MYLQESRYSHILAYLRHVILVLGSTLLAGCANDTAAPVDNLVYPPAVTQSNTSMKTVVLLLPSSGDFGKEGQMIQTAFMKAYQESGKTTALKAVTIDTSTDATPNSNYERALEAHADLIVGPLTKPDVNALLQRTNLPVATLALNQVDVSNIAPLNLYQFSLSPQADATQTAKKMQGDGLHKALVIAPAGAWGQAIATSFGETWLGADNQILDSLAYHSKDNISGYLKELFDRNASDIQNQTGVFVVASSSDTAKIIPILKQYGKNLPIYALPISYDGANQTMLEGIHFAVSPWDLYPQNPARLAFQKAYPNATWRESNLYAFGLDAYALANYALFNSGFYGISIDGQSGYLTIDPNGIIQRKLTWVTAQNGQLVVDQQNPSGAQMMSANSTQSA